MRTRRQIFRAAAAASALPILGQHPHSGSAPAARPPYKPAFFDKAQYAIVSQAAERIIPRTDTPGAIDAGVPEFLDRAAAGSRELGLRLRTGVQQLAKDGFARADEAGQIALLQKIAATPFFKVLKDLTIDAYYGSREGLTQELGWNANTFLPEFKGCTHPEHQS